jgi:hypothetical protein
VGFDFQVALVSLACDRSGSPKLEIPIEVDEQGRISVVTRDLEELGPQTHRWTKFPCRISFTVERWIKCCAIRDGIAKLDKLLFELLGNDGEKAELKLDAIGSNPLRLMTAADGTISEEDSE